MSSTTRRKSRRRRLERKYKHDSDVLPWIEEFTSIRGHEFFCKIDESYITDQFNLYGLYDMFENPKVLIDIITDKNIEKYLQLGDNILMNLDKHAEVMYGLIHARYILTTKGLDKMVTKYQNRDFGTCPSFFCDNTAVVPCGLDPQVGQKAVCLYCPRCEKIYHPKKNRHLLVDGAFFGPTFPHLFFLTYPSLKPMKIAPELLYTPKIYGFPVHPNAYKVRLKEKNRQQYNIEDFLTPLPEHWNAGRQTGRKVARLTPGSNITQEKRMPERMEHSERSSQRNNLLEAPAASQQHGRPTPTNSKRRPGTGPRNFI